MNIIEVKQKKEIARIFFTWKYMFLKILLILLNKLLMKTSLLILVFINTLSSSYVKS